MAESGHASAFYDLSAVVDFVAVGALEIFFLNSNSINSQIAGAEPTNQLTVYSEKNGQKRCQNSRCSMLFSLE
jgi:hypothetical protein